MSDNLHSDIYNKALDIISRREQSGKEVLNKLTRKFDADEVVESVIEKLISNNLINDSITDSTTSTASNFLVSLFKTSLPDCSLLEIISRALL
jgi:hypothetical protein